jgi:hypothetical protein
MVREREREERKEKILLIFHNVFSFFSTTFQGLSHTHTHMGSKERWVDGKFFSFLLSFLLQRKRKEKILNFFVFGNHLMFRLMVFEENGK